MSDDHDPPKATTRPSSPETTSAALLQGHTELLIRHGEETYRLKLTRSDKLILQK